MTKKLYYDDAYIKEFSAKVISSVKTDIGFDVILDQTAFFPEEGGQSSDGGKMDGIEVLAVYEKEGIVHHILNAEPQNDEVFCKLDFDERFAKMQCHTAEHIVCGIIHRLFGYENVGFHIGADEVTFDVDGVLTREQLNRVELEANAAVFANIQVETLFPCSEQLADLEYRSKLELNENVRIVKIGDVDSCACCAPHVSYTGEIGLIKILDFMKHRGGTRMWLAAGYRALADYRKKYENILKISAFLSAPQNDTAEILEKYIKESEAAKGNLKRAKLAIAEMRAENMPLASGNSVCFFDDFSIEELRAFSNIYNKKVSGVLVAVSGKEGEYRYIVSSLSADVSALIKDANKSLSGRGGGKREMVQGTFCASLEEIKKYFK